VRFAAAEIGLQLDDWIASAPDDSVHGTDE
jgi:hypothetical protein